MNLRFLALFGAGYMLACAVDHVRRGGLSGEQEKLFALEDATNTLPDPSVPAVDMMRYQLMEREAGLGGTLIHLG